MKDGSSRAGCPYHRTDGIERFDMLDETARRNPWPFYDWLRLAEDRRVYKLEDEEDFYVLHQYEDVKSALTASDVLSSKIIPTKESLFLALMDGEEHRRVRSVLAQLFLPKTIDVLLPEMRNMVQLETAKCISSDRFELLNEWAIPIATKMLAILFGLPSADNHAKLMYKRALAINKAIFVTGGTGPRRSSHPTAREKFRISLSIMKNLPLLIKLGRHIGWRGCRELFRKFSSTQKEANIPRPNFDMMPLAIGPFLAILCDMADRLKQRVANDNLDKLISNNELSFVDKILATAFVLFAGHETTTGLLSNAMAHLTKYSVDFNKIKEDPTLIEFFVEEVLRYYTPVGRFLRRATVDFKVGDHIIPKDSIILLMLGAANTDPEKFEDACKFNMHREKAAQHLSFGKGAHFCLGAYLAKEVVKMSLSEMLAKVSRLDEDESIEATFVVNRDNGLFRYEKFGIKLKPDK